MTDVHTEMQRMSRFLDELTDAIGLDRLHEEARLRPGHSTLDDDIIETVRRMRETLDLLAGMLPEDYLTATARITGGRSARDRLLMSAIAPILTVWKADVWNKR